VTNEPGSNAPERRRNRHAGEDPAVAAIGEREELLHVLLQVLDLRLERLYLPDQQSEFHGVNIRHDQRSFNGIVVIARSTTTAMAIMHPTNAWPAGGSGKWKTKPCKTESTASAIENWMVRELRRFFSVMALSAGCCIKEL